LYFEINIAAVCLKLCNHGFNGIHSLKISNWIYSFRTQVPLLSIVVGKYYLAKEKVERKIVWGIGQDKRLQQYRIPQNVQGWTGSSGNAVHAHFNLPGHSKIGTALC
jgi:hypothetical protein